MLNCSKWDDKGRLFVYRNFVSGTITEPEEKSRAPAGVTGIAALANVQDKGILAAGGSGRHCWFYEIEKDEWRDVNELEFPRSGIQFVTQGEYTYVFGGFNSGFRMDS